MKQTACCIQQSKRKSDGNLFKQAPSWKYVTMICHIYGGVYDDRKEDSKINGLNWEPGKKACHKSMTVFQKELKEIHGIYLSKTKVQKILITGGCWTTERSREIQGLYKEYITPMRKGGKGMEPNEVVRSIAKHLGISTVSVIINLPYGKGVYDLEKKSENARRIEKCRARKKLTKI